jgi:hypothetical protein
MGKFLLGTGKIWAGLAILEDGYDKTAELHAVRPAVGLSIEPKLLERNRHYFPRLPVDALNVLVVETIGKTYSGTGMDPNVIGFRGVKNFEDVVKPDIRIIAVLRLAEASQGNAIGVGLADFITRDLRSAIDEEKTFINVITTGDMERAKIPATLENDETLIGRMRDRFGDRRWMFIPNTLHLETLYVSEDLVDEIKRNPICEVESKPIDLPFASGQQQLSWS